MYRISKKFSKLFDESYDKRIELAGIIVPTNHGNVIELVPKVDGEGSIDKATLSLSTYNFHTHPSICGMNGQCAIQGPSAIDFASFFHQACLGMVTTFVLAEMGVYMVSVSKEIDLGRITEAQRDKVKRYIQEYFEFVEKFFDKYEGSYSKFEYLYFKAIEYLGIFDIHYIPMASISS